MKALFLSVVMLLAVVNPSFGNTVIFDDNSYKWDLFEITTTYDAQGQVHPKMINVFDSCSIRHWFNKIGNRWTITDDEGNVLKEGSIARHEYRDYIGTVTDYQLAIWDENYIYEDGDNDWMAVLNDIGVGAMADGNIV